MLNWIELITATVSASLVGSLHCVGMCGPFAIMATHGKPGSQDNAYLRVAGYHLGRLTTYLSLGTLAGVAGAFANNLGSTIGISHTSAVVVAASMVLLGIARLLSLSQKRTHRVSHSTWLQRWTQSILAVGKRIRPASPAKRAYVIGLITTWLPCGWLYLFALAASSTGSVLGANTLMIAFWMGTLPLLSVVSVGSESLLQGLTPKKLANSPLSGWITTDSLQRLAACLMIGFGVYTFFHRTPIALERFVSTHRNGEITPTQIYALTEEPLPCCSQVSPVSNRFERADEP